MKKAEYIEEAKGEEASSPMSAYTGIDKQRLETLKA